VSCETKWSEAQPKVFEVSRDDVFTGFPLTRPAWRLWPPSGRV